MVPLIMGLGALTGQSDRQGSPRSIRNVPTDKYPGVETKPPEKTKTAQADKS